MIFDKFDPFIYLLCSMHAHLKEGGMKFVVYRYAKESELSDELLMVSLVNPTIITCPVAMETSIHLCRLVNQSCCTI